MARGKNKGVRRGLRLRTHLAKKQHSAGRHWPASFLWSPPANAVCAVWYIDNRNISGLYDNPVAGKALPLELGASGWRGV